ncbi:MAG: alpha/beta hydrolase [Deltaproteobacteria bacterium]|nr:alpha/beta hydrolase [Deltaproteobacteria bacterium]
MKRTLLFLPGAGGDPDFWRPLGDLLPQTWGKTYFAWPGLGKREADPEVNGFDDLVTLVEKEMKDNPVDILAQSMGGLIGARIALKHPEKVRRLVLAATTAGGVRAADYGARDWRPDYRSDYPAAASWISDDSLDFTNEPREITQPTLLFWSDADTICPLAVGKELLRIIPDSRLVIVPGGDHGFVRDRPQEIVKAVKEHLE